MPSSFKCLSEIDNISKFSLRLSFAWVKMFTEFCTFTLDKKSTRQSKPLFCLAGAIISLGFSKIWINCKDFVLYLSGKYQSAGVKRYFKEDELWLFSKFVFSTAASRSLFSQEISIHCYSYFRGFWSNDLTNAATFKTYE